jgi:hypothetical protein
MLTRDSQFFIIVQWTAIVLGVLSATITDPEAYGLTPILMRWVSLLAVIMGTVAGRLGASPLPGARDAYVQRDIDTTPKGPSHEV